MRLPLALYALGLAGCCGSKPTASEAMPAGSAPTVATSQTQPVASTPPPVERHDPEPITRVAAILAGTSTEKPTKQEKEKGLGLTRYYKLSGPDEWLIVTGSKDSDVWTASMPRTLLSVDQLAASSGVKKVCSSTEDPAKRETRTWHQLTGGTLAGAYVIPVDEKNLWLVSDGFAEVRPAQTGCLALDRCASGKSPRVKHKAQPSAIMVACRGLVKEKLLSPAGADFQGVFDGLTEPEPQPDCSYKWSSWVDAPNALNVKIRKKFTCSWDPATDMVTGKLD